MRIIVTGCQGQLVQSLVERARTNDRVEVIPVGRPLLDLAQPDRIAAALAEVAGDIVVNAAAYTAVDQAEREPELAQTVNGVAAGAVAAAAAARGLPVIQISTDYVFDGSLDGAYRETDSVHPVSAYGRSKLAGEQAALAANDKATILRTAWVYSPFGNNFAKTMLRVASTRSELNVVADQWGAPTCALDIADGVLAVAQNLMAQPSQRALYGVFHMSAQGRANWADFAEAVFAASRAAGGPSATVNRIATAEYPTLAKRPANSQLDGGRLAALHKVALPDWRSSVAPVVARLLEA